MSVLVMPDEFFDKLANELRTYAEYSGKEVDTMYLFAYQIRVSLGYDASAFSAPADSFPRVSEFVQKLYAVNVGAFNARYAHNRTIQKEEAAVLRFTRQAYWPQWTPIQFYKLLSCLLYNMPEDTSEGAKPIYDQLDKLIKELAEVLVSQLPEYEQAAWTYERVPLRAVS